MSKKSRVNLMLMYLWRTCIVSEQKHCEAKIMIFFFNWIIVHFKVFVMLLDSYKLAHFKHNRCPPPKERHAFSGNLANTEHGFNSFPPRIDKKIDKYLPQNVIVINFKI